MLHLLFTLQLAGGVCGNPPPLGADGRPILTGPEIIHLSDDGLFKIHYTLSGADTISNTADVDPQNGVPDAIDWAEAGMAKVYQEFVLTDGWPPPPADENLGGDNRVDVYLRKLDINGCTHVQQLPSGAKASWIEVNPNNSLAGDKMTFESVAGHELHHILQFSITDRLPIWIYEATSTYVQYLLFEDPLLDTAREVLWRIRLYNSNLALASTEVYEFHYAAMIWIKFLVDYSGGKRKAILDLWRAMGTAGDWEAGHDAALPVSFGLPSLAEAAAQFAVWNWFACGNDDGHHYDPGTVACAAAGVAPEVQNSFPRTFTTPTLGHLGSTYVMAAADCASGELSFTVSPPGPTRISVIRAPSLGEPMVTTQDAPAGQNTTITVSAWNDWHRVVLVVTNLGAADETVDLASNVHGAYQPPSTPPMAVSVELQPTDVKLRVGDSLQLSALARYGTCLDGQNVSGSATWTSSDERIARVDKGKVVAVAPGTTDVAASVAGAGSNRITVVVNPQLDGGGCQIAGRGRPGWTILFALGLIILARKRPA